MSNFITIAIDGAAASGKTSTSLKLAKKYNMLAFSTGMCYRAVTLTMLDFHIDVSDKSRMENFLSTLKLGTKVVEENTIQILINERCYEEADLRSSSVNEHVAAYSAVPEVRKFLLDYQRAQVKFASENGFDGLIMEGRDITSVILPEASLKFFLEASSKARSLRRKVDNEEDYVFERDKSDAERMICTDGVYRIDTGKYSLDEVVEIISQKIDEISKISLRAK